MTADRANTIAQDIYTEMMENLSQFLEEQEQELPTEEFLGSRATKEFVWACVETMISEYKDNLGEGYANYLEELEDRSSDWVREFLFDEECGGYNLDTLVKDLQNQRV